MNDQLNAIRNVLDRVAVYVKAMELFSKKAITTKEWQVIAEQLESLKADRCNDV
jgi:hypothetical protein